MFAETTAPPPRTLFEKIWSRHRVKEREDGQTLLYVDRHFMHEGAAAAFDSLRRRGLKPHAPDRTVAVPDHYVPTDTRRVEEIADARRRGLVETLARDSAEHGIRHFRLGGARQGIVHIIGPETGLTQPGLLLVCGDSHTSTHGAVGALAFGIGSTEVTHVLATQTLWQRKPKTLRITVDGALAEGVTAKDVILAIIARIGAAGATGYVIEYAGEAMRALSMEGRLTLCNMSIEAGGRAGMVAPDDTAYAYLAGRDLRAEGRRVGARADPLARLADGGRRRLRPRGVARRRPHDADGDLGHEPGERVADHRRRARPGSVRRTRSARAAMARALDYMGLRPGTALGGRGGRSGVHRLLHQRPHRGPAPRRGGRARAARLPRTCEAWSCRARSP